MKKIICFLIGSFAFLTMAKAQSLPLIPYPTEVIFKKGIFSIEKVKTLFIESDSLKKEAVVLQEILKSAGISVGISNKEAIGSTPHIVLRKLKNGESKEAYHLKITDTNISIEAVGNEGIFYGIQTLKQLIHHKKTLAAVEINDSPAFAWRGYMVDVGRNFQSIGLLKQQIDIMAAYKLNIFHFHFTEDIAWRLAIKKYPQLTESDNMLRNKGMFYTEAEFTDLINYCKERYITLVPEIDMPGHSAAFKRAMGVDMQSDSGVYLLKNILGEFFSTYDLPYFHIGADEVKITNKNFVPEMTKFIESFGKKTIGWEPGGNFNSSTIRQLWMDDAGLTGGNTNIKFIDSRHLYLNHMDPFESVVTIFNRQLCDVNKGNEQALGATLCLWPDRRVAKEEDNITMNSVYPAMLAFAERTWRGGGYAGWVANMGLNGDAALKEFRAFEDRLTRHQHTYFRRLPFPYQKQANVSWKLFGPFNNEGDLTKKFNPELPTFEFEKEKPAVVANGATLILRHWWAPKIKAVLPSPIPNSTWYAFTKVWAKQDGWVEYWIGFSNPSRSQATDSPQAGTWDNHSSEIWINGKVIPPPVWQNAGQKGNLEIPLVDEGYEYRKPISLHLKKGWNTVRIKAPIGSFNGKNWNNPEKWMLTFIPAR